MNLQYEPDFTDQSKLLSEAESYHVLTVLRKKPGDEVFVTNGFGTIFHCQLTGVRNNRCELRVESSLFHEKPETSVHLIISVLKTSERMEWLTEKAVELGASSLTFFYSDRSERKNINTGKLLKVAVSALKQSGRCWLPAISGPVRFQDALSVTMPVKFVASLMKDHRTSLFSAFVKNEQTAVLIGPEGDFTSEEMNLTLKSGFIPVTLGAFTLRSETAALAALQTLIIAGTR